MGRPLKTAAVVGGGIAGFAAAATFAGAGGSVDVFDRGRAIGGRASTRVSRSGVAFDHGSPCFTAESEAFAAVVKEWVDAGVVAPWAGRFLRADPGGQRDAAAGDDPAAEEASPVRWRPDPRERFVGVPTMAALVERLAATAGVTTHAKADVTALLGEPAARGSAGPWLLRDAEGGEHGPFDAVVVAVAAPQAARLVAEPAPRLARLAERAKPAGCFSVMLAFEEPLNLLPAGSEDPTPVDAVRLDRGPLSWAGRETTKPGRGAGSDAECWVLHARPTWAASRFEDPAEEVLVPLKAAFERIVGRPLPEPTYEAAHRWKFAHCAKPLPDPSYVSPKHGLAACGDWFGGRAKLAGMEAAFLSGRHAAETLVAKLAAAETD